MDCRGFEQRLADYLAGRVSAEDFGELVAHEATCSACRDLAAEAMGAADPHAGIPSSDAASQAWMHAVLRRTVGADCRGIAWLLAEEVDAPLDPRTTRLVDGHLAACSDCRALAGAMRDLPRRYTELARLKADRTFMRAVLRRTCHADRPGILETVAAMWRRPGLLWEGALLCALLSTPLLSDPARRVTATVQEARPLSIPVEYMQKGWSRVDEEIFEKRAFAVGFDRLREAVHEQRIALRSSLEEAGDRLLSPDSLIGRQVAVLRAWFQAGTEWEDATGSAPVTIAGRGEKTAAESDPGGSDAGEPQPGEEQP
ncbi:MAG: hypothetical protein V1774_04405 [Candidatus Eisenbacteria bacterium]